MIKQNLLKKVLLAVIPICTVLTSTPTYANELKGEEIIEQNVLSFASLFSDEKLSVNNMIPIVDTEEGLMGYSVCLESNGVQYGYVNYELEEENPISDFSIGEGNDYIIEVSESESNIVLVTDGAGSYEVSTVSDYTKYASASAIFSSTYITSGYILAPPKFTSKYSRTKSFIWQFCSGCI